MRTMMGLMVAVFLLAAGSAPAQPASDKLPWEDPQSGFGTTTGTWTTGGGATSTIETTVETSGGSKDDGTTVSDQGTDQQKGFVDGFLKDTSDKIKGAGGGSGWVWTWQKKWKIGPDGKPYEVNEDWQRGSINASMPNVPVSSDGKTPTTGPDGKPTTGTTPTGPATTAKPTTGPGPTTTATVPDSPPEGFDMAPPDLPDADVRLVIQNPVTQQESGYPNNVFPTLASPPLTTLACKNPPVPEDTRVKLSLEFDPAKVQREDLTLTVTDNEGPALVPSEEIGSYRHIFRVPDMTPTYTAVVTYKHPMTGETKEIIKVAIPVYPLDFKSRTVEHEQRRTDGQ